MNSKSIETAKDPDLAQSLQALRRAAQRARDLAAQTGTNLIVQRDAKIEPAQPLRLPTAPLR